MSGNRMKAVLVHEFGPAERLCVEEAEMPRPGPGEAMIEVIAVAANFVDTLVVTGAYQFLPERPFSPGKLPAGIVRAVGEDVTDVAVGDRVLTMAEKGGFAQYALADAARCYRLPDSMSFAEAASIALCFDTAWFALRERARIRAGESVLVLGATGAVGIAAIQLARTYGARVLAGVSSPDRAEPALKAGASEIVDLSGDDIGESLRRQVRPATDGAGTDIVIDTLGDRFTFAAMRAMAWRGRLVVIGFAAGQIPTVKTNYLLVKNIEISGLQVSDYRTRTPDLMRECFEEIFDLHANKQITAPEFEVAPLEDAGRALARIRDRKARARIIIAPAGVEAAG